MLYHLRADLESLYGVEASSVAVSSSHVLLATTGILNGIDYLSQVYSAETGQRKRFTETLRVLLGVSVDDAEALYQLRCALVHQVGLSVQSQSSYRNGTIVAFELADGQGQPMIQKSFDSFNEISYSVGFWELKRFFVALADKLRSVCEDLNHPRHKHVIKQVGKMHAEKLLKR